MPASVFSSSSLRLFSLVFCCSTLGPISRVGCQSTPSTTTTTPVPERLVAEASILRHTKGGDEHIFLPITFRGHTVTAVLDLGSSGNLLNSQFMADTTGDNDMLKEVTFGTDTLHDVGVISIPSIIKQMSRVSLPGWPPVAALFGVGVVSQYDLVFDGPARRVRLYAPPPHPASGNAPMWLPPGITPADCVHMTVPEGFEGMVFLPIQVNGHQTDSYFDSGSKSNYMNIMEARHLGMTEQDPHMHLLPADSGSIHPGGGRPKTYVWQGATMQVGRHMLSNQRVEVLDASPERDSLQVDLGLDAFRDRILFVSNSTGQACLGGANASPPLDDRKGASH